MSSLNIDLQGSDCNDSRKSIDISMQSGGDCDSGGRLNPSFGGGGLSCYPPCAHTHPIDGGAWGITVLDSTAWLGKIPEWNGTQFVPVSGGGGGGGVTSFNSRTGAVTSQAGDYNTDIVAEGVTNLYWTPTRFNLAFSAKTTTDLTEGINLYFTDLRAISAPLTGYVSGAGTITAADSVLQAIQKLDGNISSLTTGVSSVFGRTGAVTAQSGDYNTDLVTEGITNLYWTNSRTINSTLTGYVSGSGTITSSDSVLTAIQKLNGNISSGYVPYLGATANVDLGIYDLNAQGLKITGVNGNGHLTLRWQAIDPTSSGNHTTFFANIVGDLKYKIANTYFTTFSTSANTSDRTYTFPDTNGTVVLGTGAINELTYWSSTNIISSLNTGTYPSLTEISYVKGVTSAIQTQLNAKAGSIGTIDSQSKVANGLVLTSGVLYAQTADATSVGMVSIGTQTFAGAKTFNANGAASTPSVLLSGTIFSGGNTFTTTPQLLVEPTKSSYSSVTGNASTDVITATGHNFTVGTGVRFSSLTGGSGLSTNTLYYVGNVVGNTFQLATSLALAISGSFINFTTNITDGTIVASSGWNTNGTLLGLSSNTGFTGDLINIQENGQPRFKIATTSSNNTITTFNGYASASGSVRVTLDNISNGGILSLIADSAGTNTVTTNYIMGLSSGINIVAGNSGNQTITLNGTIKASNGKTFVASNGRTFLTVNENTGNAQARIGLGLGSALTSGTESVFNLAGAATPASGSTIMYGFSIQSAMTASANNQAMTALYIQPSFSNGAFTGVTNNLINVLSSGGNNIFKASNGGQIDIGYSSATMGFYGVTAISRPTTSISGATRVGGGGTTVTDTDTFGGYTIAKVVQALINLGLLT